MVSDYYSEKQNKNNKTKLKMKKRKKRKKRKKKKIRANPTIVRNALYFILEDV